MKITFYAAAKINLFLEILGKLPNGYHEVDMIMQSVSLYDQITIEQNPKADGILLQGCAELNCSHQENAITRAANAFLEYTKKQVNLQITLQKNIPVCAGLAGGSADAAATLLALNEFLGAGLLPHQLLEIAKTIGADVPFCLLGGTMRAQNTGTTLQRLNSLAPCFFVLVKPNLKISTKTAYEASDNCNYVAKIGKMQCILNSIQSNNSEEISANLFNRFESVLNLKETAEIKAKLKSHRAQGACMSGSGPTVFGMFMSKKAAQNCVTQLKKEYADVFLCEPTKNSCFNFSS